MTSQYNNINPPPTNQPGGYDQAAGYSMVAPQYSGIPEATLVGNVSTVPVYYDNPGLTVPTGKSSVYPDIESARL